MLRVPTTLGSPCCGRLGLSYFGGAVILVFFYLTSERCSYLEVILLHIKNIEVERGSSRWSRATLRGRVGGLWSRPQMPRLGFLLPPLLGLCLQSS